MTTGIDSYIREQFGVADVDVRTYSPLTLAYIGDGIFDLVIRSVVVGKGNTKSVTPANEPYCKGTHTGGHDRVSGTAADRGGTGGL